jgi:hypothetical protein
MCLLPLELTVCPHGENSQDENTVPQPFQYQPVRHGHSVIKNVQINDYLRQKLLLHLLFFNFKSFGVFT